MSAVLSRMRGDDLFLLAVLAGEDAWDAVDGELDRRAAGARRRAIRLPVRDLVASRPPARPAARLAVAA